MIGTFRRVPCRERRPPNSMPHRTGMTASAFLSVLMVGGLAVAGRGLAAEPGPAAGIPIPDDAPKPRSPEETVRSYQLPDGFRLEVVASEPLIASPSGVCWDERGRMFVSELHGYNLEGQLDIEALNKSGRLDTQVRRVEADDRFKQAAKAGTHGVVKMLVDTNADGRMDQAIVWATNLPPAYGLVPARGGVIVACAPDIVYLADWDGDGRPEVREVLFTGFRTGALERGINAPLWHVDGWIYIGHGRGGRAITGPRLAGPVALPDSDFRIRPDGSAIEPVTGSTHTLGFTFTEAGERFVTTTSVPGIFIAPMEWRYLARNPNAAMPGLSLATGDRRAYQISAPHPWRTKRAEHAAYAKFYRDRYGASESDASGWFTAACGALVYQDPVLPGLQGQYFVCEPSGNFIHRALIEPDGTALRLVRPPGEERSEFAAARDGWSHPIRLHHGPDGGIWVVDYYREIIEDYSAIPRHLQQQYGLYAGHDRGRIYRLTHREAPAPPSPDMASLKEDMLARELISPLIWRRETARRLLVERQMRSAGRELRSILPGAAVPAAGVINVAHTLDQLGELHPENVVGMLRHSHAAVRLHGLRLAEAWLGRADGETVLGAMLGVVSSETDPRVVLQLALSLGETRDPRAFAALARLARTQSNLRWMDAALLSSVAQRGGEMLVELLREPAGPDRVLEQLAGAVGARRESAELARVLNALAGSPPGRQVSILNGLARGRANARREPLGDAAAVRALATLAASASADVRRAARLVEDTFIPAPPDEEAVAGLPPAPPVVTEEVCRRYVAALAASRDTNRGHQVYQQACATCHRIGDEGHAFGPDLLGEIGMAEETLVRHLLLPSDRIRPGFETTLVETAAGTVLAGLLHEDGATSLTVRQPGGIEKVVLRKDVTGVRSASVSMMPSFAETLSPADVADVLGWLRAHPAAAPAGRRVLFDEEPEFATALTEGGGRAEVVRAGAFAGVFCLRVTPPQRYGARLAGWGFRIVEKPSAPDEYRYLRLAWRAAGAGVMLEIAGDGQWPRAEEPRRRYYAGTNTTAWQARRLGETVPAEWREEVIDLWADAGAFSLTGVAPTAMGGEAFFDRLELWQERPAVGRR